MHRQSVPTNVRCAGVPRRPITDGGWWAGFRGAWSGVRAFGNRSIIGDPRRADMKDIRTTRSEAARVVSPVRTCRSWTRGGVGVVELDGDVPL